MNLGSHYIEVNGTLSAIGTPANMITFSGGQITFTTSSNGWNEQTQSGCLIENAVISQTKISSSNPIKIDNSVINGPVSVTSSIISNNIIKSDLNSRSSIVSYNNIDANIVLGNFSPMALSAPDTSTISNNIIEGSISAISSAGVPQIFNNTISNGGIGCSGYSSIYNNYIYGCQVGISLSTPRVFGGNLPCYATVENNLVVDNINGISIGLTSTFGPGTICPTITGNTISRNSVGISLSESYYDSSPTIQNNNLQDNSQYNFYLTAPNNVDASNNWWGTTNDSAISNSIYDYKNDFDVGTVNFTPFLTAPNPGAPANANSTSTPTPTPTSTLTPTPTPAPTPLSTTVAATSNNGSSIELSISGNITSAQMTNVTITTDATTTRVSFTLTGQSNTTGFGNVTVPKSAVATGTVPTIYIDNLPTQNQGYTQDSNNYYVWYTTHFSTHQVSIVFTTTPPALPPTSSSGSHDTIFLGLGWVQIGILTLMVVVVAVVVVAAFKFLSKKKT